MSGTRYVCPVECTKCPIDDCQPREMKRLVTYKQVVAQLDSGAATRHVAEILQVSRGTIHDARQAFASGELSNIPLVEA